MSTPADPSPTASVARLLAFALCTSPALLLLVMSFVLPINWDDEPPLAVLALLVGMVGIAFVSAEAIGFITEPLSTELAADPVEAGRVSASRYQAAMLLRFALTEVPILVGLAASFVLDAGLWPFLAAVLISMPVMWFETWPSRRNVRKFAARLEAGGVRSNLAEVYGIS